MIDTHRSLDISALDAGPGTPQIVKIGWEDHPRGRYRCHPGQWPHHQVTVQITRRGCGVCWIGTDGAHRAVPPGSALVYDNRADPTLGYGVEAHGSGWGFLYVNLAGSVAIEAVADIVSRAGHVVAVVAAESLVSRFERLLPAQGVAHRSWPAAEGARHVYQLLAALSPGLEAGDEPTQPHQSLAERARRMLAERHYERWSMRRLALELGVTREHLSRVFSQVHGQAPTRWLRTYRVERACELLRGGQTVADIAEACGFGDPTNFAHAFRAELGCTPSDYREGRITR